MLVEIKTIEHVDRMGRKSHHDVLVMKCDTCGKEWETRGSKTRVLSRKTHACSSECKSNAHKNGGVVERQRAATCVERFGTENPFASEQCKEKMRTTWKEKYGVEHARSSDEVKAKVKATMLDRWGVDHPMHSPTLKNRQIETMQRNWDVSYPMQLSHVREAMIAGTIKKYGVPYHLMNPEQARRVLEKRAREGTLFKSKPEDTFHVALVEKFSEDDVIRQVVMNKHWCIDFYIKSINTYVQFDGVYWHGLDRHVELIKESARSGHKRDMGIYRKWLVDQQQTKWFIDNDLKLVRITDREFKADPEACLLRLERSS